MDNITTSAQLHQKIMQRTAQSQAPLAHSRFVPRYVVLAACAVVLLVGAWLLPGLWDNSTIGGTGPAAILPSDPATPPHATALPLYALTFNATENMMSVRPDRRLDFWHELTDAQFAAAFPTLNESLSAQALYQSDGTLIEVAAFGSLGTEQHLRIRLAEGMVAQTVLIIPEEPPHISYVHQVPVTAFMSGERDSMYFQAEFILDNIAYHVSLIDSEEAGQQLLTELVNRIIIGGAADLSGLTDPVIPKLRNEQLTLSQARLDPDFGAFLPTNLPPRFGFESAYRFINQDTNSLFVLWSANLNTIRWEVSRPTSFHLEHIVSANEREKFDMSLYSIPLAASIPDELWQYVQNPVFRADELTLDIVRARAYSTGRGGGGASDQRIMNFSALYGDVVVSVSAGGVTPEQIWEMLEGLARE